MSLESGGRTLQSAGRPRGAPRSREASAGSAIDYQLIGIVATLALVGLVMVFSASSARVGTHFFLRQLAWVVLGAIVFGTMALIPYRFWQRVATPVMIVALLLLVAVLIKGDQVGGANRTFMGGSLQPSEIAKLAVVIYVAAWVASLGKRVATISDGLLPFVIIMGLVAGLIVLEKSFSVTLITLAIGVTIYSVAGGSIKQLLMLAAIAAPLLLLAMWIADYPFDRIEGWYNVWFNPSLAPDDQAKIAWMLREGRGIGTAPDMWQVKASVPGLWSDYLFANIGADLPIFGPVIIIGLYAWFGYRALGIALNAPTRFGAMAALGVTAWILIQAAIHIGTSLALIPVTGQPLPFMSYGGSSLLSCMAAAGLLLSISREQNEGKSVYAHFSVGGWHWRPRLPDLGRRRRSAGAADSSESAGWFGRRPAERGRSGRRRVRRNPSPATRKASAATRTGARR